MRIVKNGPFVFYKWGPNESWQTGYPGYKNPTERTCLHKSCSECGGTGVKRNGGPCVHYISCPCSRCNPFYL